MKNIKQFTGFATIAVLIGLFVLGSTAIRIVDAGERAVVTRVGEVNRVLAPGLHFIIPFVEQTTSYEVRTVKIETSTNSASQDLQSVQTTIALNFNVDPNKVGEVYADVRNDYMRRIVEPSIQESVKAATALFNAEALITRRSEVREQIQQKLVERVEKRGLTISDVAIVDFRFSPEFDRAIEAKVTAEQRALEAENKLKQIEFEAQQRIEQARGEAEAIRIQAEAITQQGGKDYVQLQAIQKWDGKLPQQWVPGSAVPFINLTQYEGNE